MTFYSKALHRAVMLTLAASLSTAAVLAQESGTPPPPPQGMHGHGPNHDRQEEQLEHMTKALNLTPDQVSQMKAIQADGRTQMDALRDDSSTPGPDKRAKMMSIRDAQQTKMRALLNEDQKAKFDKMLARREEHQEHHGYNGGRGDQPPPPPPPPAQ